MRIELLVVSLAAVAAVIVLRKNATVKVLDVLSIVNAKINDGKQTNV